MTEAVGRRASRRYPDRPVAGVGAVVINGEGRVLLVRRGGEPLAGQWSLPGGGVETGETLETAVRREVLEEASLIVDVGSLVGVVDRIQRDAKGDVEYHYVLVDYRCRPTGGVLAAASDAQEAVWADPGDLDRFGLTDQTRDMIARALAG